MNYHNITTDDMRNGDGLRTVLWVAGCDHHCDGCQNPITWNPNGGIYFGYAAEQELFYHLYKKHISGVTFSGEIRYFLRIVSLFFIWLNISSNIFRERQYGFIPDICGKRLKICQECDGLMFWLMENLNRNSLTSNITGPAVQIRE